MGEERDDWVDLKSEARGIAERENLESEWISERDRKTVLTSSSQNHLPKLEAAGMIERERNKWKSKLREEYLPLLKESYQERTLPGTTNLPLNEVLRILSEPRRQNTLYYLENNGPSNLYEISKQISAWESGKAFQDITPQDSKYVSVRTCLRDNHLGKMEELDIVKRGEPEHYRRTTLVKPDSNFNAVAAYLPEYRLPLSYRSQNCR